MLQFPDAVMDSLKKLAKEVVEEEAAKTPAATKVNEAFKKFQKQVGTWATVSEMAYFNTIQPNFPLKA